MARPPRKSHYRAVSPVIPKRHVNEDFQTYTAVWTALQISPSFHAGFFNEVVRPYRQKKKALLKRGTPASFQTLTNNLIRGYGRRIWGKDSTWLIGGPRNEEKKEATEASSSEDGSSVAMEVESSDEGAEAMDGSDEDEEISEGGDTIDLHGSDGPLNEWGLPVYVKPHEVFNIPEDIVIQGLMGDEVELVTEDLRQAMEVAEEIDVTEQEDNAAGGEEGKSEPGVVVVADLDIDVPDDRERIERALDSLWRQMRDLLFEKRQ